MSRLSSEARAAASDGWSLFSELVSAIGVCTAIGFGVDKLFGWWPVATSVGAFIGHLAGVRIAFWRTKQMTQRKEGTAGR